ncbi:hydroxyacid dehydrogenase [Streptomyces sp. NPDC091376]|uniref:hydroxyacid dehydrogenase n=1 Tax=Streptomyces sp. NPDC091376 TaxID=3365994 RepID=UPI0038228E81
MNAPRRPRTLIAMYPELRDLLLDPAAIARLAGTASVDIDRVVTDLEDTEDPALGAALHATEVLLTCWGCPPLTETALARMPNLKAVVHAAGSVKQLISETGWARGLIVSAAAEANAEPVAEYTLAAILMANKRVLPIADAYRRRRGPLPLNALLADAGNYRRTVGIVGASKVGRRVIELLRPFDLHVLLFDPYVDRTAASALGVERVDLEELARRSDVVSIHAPETPETQHQFDAHRLALLRDGATLINTARGSLVDTEALTRELVAGRIHGVIDVTDPEVLPADSPLYDLPNVLLTPHMAGSLGGELYRLGEAALDELERYARGLPMLHLVEPALLARSA